MHPLIAVLAFGSLTTLWGPVACDALPDSSDWAYVEAEQDFEAVRGELGLSGSAPLVGLEALRADLTWDDGEARRDFEAVHAALGLSGSAPLVGLESYELTVRPAVAYAAVAALPESSDSNR